MEITFAAMAIPLNIDWRQILLHLFNFAILTGGLYFLLYSPIKKFIEKREEYYRTLDDEAKEKLASAEVVERKAKECLEKADQKIAEERIQAQAAIRAQLQNQWTEAQKKADQLIAEAKKAAEAEKQAILLSADREVLAITKTSTAKLLHSDTQDAYEDFLAIAERDADDGT